MNASERIVICAKHEIEYDKDITHILSLEDPSTPQETPKWFHGEHRQLHFHDFENKKDAFRAQGVAVTLQQVSEILQFGQCLQNENNKLLVHCYAGTSRSPAAAYIILTSFMNNCEQQAFDIIRKIRRISLPNGLIIKYADDILQRQGKLLAPLISLRRAGNCLNDDWLDSLFE